MERFVGHGEAAVGTNKTILNLFASPATPTNRARVYDIIVGCDATPADQATDFYFGRTTAVGTEGSGFTPNNLDNGGPAGNHDFGVAHSAEPTYTANKELLRFSLNQRSTFRWVAVAPEYELLLIATQNSGGGLKSSSSTGTPTTQACMYFCE
jgi:hypothetical protein